MGERKWAWDALDQAHETGDGEQIWRAQTLVECASIKEFTNDVFAELERLLVLTDEVGQGSVALGIRLAMREMRKLEDHRCD